jgi:hypothetical protein
MARGPSKGADYLGIFNGYYARLRAKGEFLPLGPDGKVNVSQVARDAKIGDRGRLYTNPALKVAFAEAVEASQAHAREVRATEPPPDASDGPTAPPDAPATLGDRQLQAAQRERTKLEQRCASLMAENYDLRRQLREARQQAERVDVMFQTGRRVAAPPKST